jgi:hypothetical protein
MKRTWLIYVFSQECKNALKFRNAHPKIKAEVKQKSANRMSRSFLLRKKTAKRAKHNETQELQECRG